MPCSGDAGQGYAQFLSTSTTVGSPSRRWPSAASGPAVTWLGTTRCERQSFGGPIGRKQAVAFAIADLDVMAHTARAAGLRRRGRRRTPARPAAEFKRAASIAKLYCSESAVTATRIATQVFGGYGFMEEYPVARFYRDAKVLEIGEGTSEVQRLLIARGLGLPVE